MVLNGYINNCILWQEFSNWSPIFLLLPTGTPIVLPVGYNYGLTYRSSQHIPLEEVMWKPEEEVIQITS